jgi:hypothetical protein
MSEATQRPWFVGAQNDALYIINKHPSPSNDYPRHDRDMTMIAKVYEASAANAELIVRAVNAHDDLVAALKAICEPADLDGVCTCSRCKRGRAAIAKAEGRTEDRSKAEEPRP